MPQFFWKYGGMAVHWARAHAGSTIPGTLKAQLEITAKERGIKA
jgi:hypothetical protein